MTPDHDIDTSGEYEYPPRKWQPEWVRPPSVADIPRILRDLERPGDMPTVSDLVEERNQLREWVTALVGSWPPLGDNYECLYCRHTRYLCDPANHEPDCPWRVAAEYIERLEAQDVATD